MPRPRFQALAPQKQQAILEAAADEFSRAGFEGASYNQIIARAGISKGAMYYYFDDKADLYLTIVANLSERMITAIGGLNPYNDARSFWAAVRTLTIRMFAFVAEEPRLAGIAKSLLDTTSGPLSEALARYTDQAQAFILELLESGRELGAVREDLPLPLLAHLLSGLGEAFDRWLITRWHELNAADFAALPDQVVELFIRTAAPLKLAVILDNDPLMDPTNNQG